jgi:hypothetical protein
MVLRKFMAHVFVCVTDTCDRVADEKQARNDIHAMSAAHTNKSVQVQWIDERIG